MSLIICIAGIYLGLSVLTFLAYALDKRAARQGQRRISEKTLHLLAVFCGWPGALLAQAGLRHKTSKPAFLRMFWGTMLLNLAVILVVLLTLNSVKLS